MSGSSDNQQQPPAGPDLSGRQLGDFRLLRRLGQGAMAEVYLAEQCQLKRRVAVKVLKAELAEDETYIRRFKLEAQAAASLIHANIVQIYEVGHCEQLHYIAQEYIQGQNLREWLNRNGPPDLPHAVSFMRQVASALAKAGERGVVHRDVKPENIMLTSDGEIKVADFGLARVSRRREAADLTQIGMTVGTPLYMSPEQIEARPLDPRSDLYSFGVTCYHMLTGSPPFSGETALGVAVQHLKEDPEPLESVRPDLPPELCRIVHKLLAKDPAGRWQSARELLQALRLVPGELGEDEWPEDLPDWESSSGRLPAQSRARLTERLDALMKNPSRGRLVAGRGRPLAVGLLASFLIGTTVAWFAFREPSLLADAKPGVTRQETALQQYLEASRVGTLQAWQCVTTYYPDREPFASRAKQELARIHLQQGEHDRALAICDEFIALGKRNEELYAFGLAGRYCVLTRQDRHAAAHKVLERLRPSLDKLGNPQMRKMFHAVYRKNRAELKDADRKKWDRLIAEAFARRD